MKTKKMPEPDFQDNWKQEKYDENLKEGLNALQNNQSVKIWDDGRGYELACDIKRNFILKYQKQLSEKIIIHKKGSEIMVYFK